MKKLTFPIEVSRGSSLVKIYRSKSKGYEYFKVIYYVSSGERKARGFQTFEDAEKGADDILKDLSKGNHDVLTLTKAEKHVYERALLALHPLNVHLDFAAIDYTNAVRRLGGVPLMDAVEVYLKYHPKELPQKTVREVVDELIETKTKANRAKRYIEDLAYRLGGSAKHRKRNRLSFADAFQCNISAVTSEQMQKYLNGLKLSPRSYENFRTTLTTVFNFAKQWKYLPKTHDEANHLIKYGKQNGTAEIEIFTSAELCKLLDNAPKGLRSLPRDRCIRRVAQCRARPTGLVGSPIRYRVH